VKGENEIRSIFFRFYYSFLDLRQFRVENLQAFERIIKSGLENRIMGINSKNNDSSRGHAILTLQVKNQHDNKIFGRFFFCLTQINKKQSSVFFFFFAFRIGKLVFVDLAGSERGVDAMGSVKQTQCVIEDATSGFSNFYYHGFFF
jgi:kinesin family member 2/24